MVYFIDKEGQVLDDAIDYLSRLTVIGVDTETSGLDPFANKVLLIQCGNYYNQYVFDVARLGAAIHRLRPIMEDRLKTKILHNAKFDYRFMKTNFGIEIENIFDTMMAEQLLQKGKRLSGFGLLEVADKYAGVKMNKEVRETFAHMVFGEKLSAEQIAYAAEDVQFLERILQAEKTLLQRDGLEKVAHIEMNVIQATADMELAGMKIDKDKWLAAEAMAKVERAKAKQALDKMLAPFAETDIFGDPAINYNSSKQLLTILKKALPKENIKSTNESDIKDIGHPIIEALLTYRGMEKRVSTYGEAFLQNVHRNTGKIHTTFEMLRTDTGRYSSSNPNLQNIPAKDTSAYREAFVAFSENDVLVDADYSNMELRILADLSLEPAWMDIFERGLDMHSHIGSMIFGVEIRAKGTNGKDDPGLNTDLRKIAKSLNFGLSYGMGPQKLSREAQIPFSEAKEIILKFWHAFPKIKTFFDNLVEKSIANRCVRSPYDNRLRWFDGFDFDNKGDLASIKNATMNFPMQSGNASITKIAMASLRDEIKRTGIAAQPICTIHDEILMNAAKTCAPEAEAMLEKCMLDAANLYVKNVKVKVETGIASYWKK